MQPADPPSIAPATPPQERRLGDERGRYGRKTVRDQLGDLVATLRAHPVALGVVVVVFAIGAILWLLSGRPVRPEDLAVGDCLYVPTQAGADVTADRAIGDPSDVEQVLMSGGAQTAPCTGSHGHEVSAIVGLGVPLASGVAPTQAGLRAYAQTVCEQAFPGYVGHPLAGSVYETFAAAPTIEAWNAGQGNGVCLVARLDGLWMTHPARNSGE